MFDEGTRVLVIGGPMFLRSKRATVKTSVSNSQILVEIDGMQGYSSRIYQSSELRLLTPEELDNDVIEDELIEEEIPLDVVWCSINNCDKEGTTDLIARVTPSISFNISVCDECFQKLYDSYEENNGKVFINLDVAPEKI
jgi:hypothetical protein